MLKLGGRRLLNFRSETREGIDELTEYVEIS